MTSTALHKTHLPPDEARLRPGTDLLLKFGDLKGDFKTKLVGVLPFECIITTLPRIANAGALLQPDAPLTIRYMVEGTVYGFHSRVIGHIQRPLPLLFAAYPQRLDRFELRKTTRLNCFMPATLHSAHGGFRAYVVDLSAGGCRVNCPRNEHSEATAVGDGVLLELPLAEGCALVLARGEVRNRLHEDRLLSLGIAFSSVEPGAELKLQAFLEEGRLYA